MNNLRTNKNTKTYSLLQYLLITLLILESNSIYSQIYGSHLYIRTAIIIISTIIILIFILNKKTILHKKTLQFIAYVLFCSSFMIINTNSLNGEIIILLVFLLYLPLSLIYLSNLSTENFKDLLKKFVNVVIVLCLISLIFWILTALLNIIQPTGKIKAVWARPYSTFDTFFYLHFNTQEVWWITGLPLIRNTGIFTEGPMYAFVLIVALIFNNIICFENTKSNFMKNVILCATMISTISITGIICAILIVLPNIKKYALFMKKSYRAFLMVSLILMVICTIPIGLNFLSKKMNTASATHRNMDIKIGIDIFSEKPILGYGINHEREDENDYENGYGYSNAIIPVLTDGGMLLGAIYILPIYLLAIKGIKRRKINYILFSVVYTILLFTTLIQYRLLIIFLINIIFCITHNNYIIEGGECCEK